jgi:riboflavin synthase
MFTGLIEGIGKIKSIKKIGMDMNLTVMPLFDMADSKIGDSVSVDGVCLTITALKDKTLSMYASEETVFRSTMGRLRLGDEVNLERALSLAGRLGGHMVSGHVDGVGRIVRKEQIQRSWMMRINIDKDMSRYVIQKGSIAVDGISMTVNSCKDDFFEVNIIPETAIVTTILKKNVGDIVNIETDLIAKYVEKFIKRDKESGKDTASGHIDKEMLERYGFGE